MEINDADKESRRRLSVWAARKSLQAEIASIETNASYQGQSESTEEAWRLERTK